MTISTVNKINTPLLTNEETNEIFKGESLIVKTL